MPFRVVGVIRAVLNYRGPAWLKRGPGQVFLALWLSAFCLLFLAQQKALYRPLVRRVVQAQCDVIKANLPKCPATPPGLEGRRSVNMTDPGGSEALDALLPGLLEGGRWLPRGCKSHSRVALVIPYRNRESNLRVFLQHIHPFLQRQLIEYTVFVVEQAPGSEFNRGMIKNIAFIEANKLGDFECTIFHDVDLLPENDDNMYHCTPQPKHLVLAIDINKYVPYAGGAVFGGAVLFQNEHFTRVNGYSNLYFGWGGEDDDLLDRVKQSGLRALRYPAIRGYYQETYHKKEPRSPNARGLFHARFEHMRNDGLNSVEYKVNAVEERKPYTWIFIELDEKKYQDEAGELLTWVEDKRKGQIAAKKAKETFQKAQKESKVKLITKPTTKPAPSTTKMPPADRSVSPTPSAGSTAKTPTPKQPSPNATPSVPKDPPH